MNHKLHNLLMKNFNFIIDLNQGMEWNRPTIRIITDKNKLGEYFNVTIDNNGVEYNIFQLIKSPLSIDKYYNTLNTEKIINRLINPNDEFTILYQTI